MERGNSKHSPREDDRLAAELQGELGPHASNREEWAGAEPPADDDAPERVGPPVEQVGEDGVPAAEAQVRHDMNVANDWHGTE